MKTYKCKPKNITIDVKFTPNTKNFEIDKILFAAFEKVGVKIDKICYTCAISPQFGTAEMPHSILAAMLICSGHSGLAWKLDEFSGKYTFKFDGEYTY